MSDSSQLLADAFSADDPPDVKIDCCYDVVGDLVANHDPESTGESTIFAVRGIIIQCNDLIGDDAEAKQGLAKKLTSLPWFKDNKQQVRYSTDLNKIGISAEYRARAGAKSSKGPQSRPVPQVQHTAAEPEEQDTAAEPKERELSLGITEFEPDMDTQSKVDFCLDAIEELLNTHDPVSTGQSMIWMMRGLILECNDVIDEDADAKQGLADKCAKHQWFNTNGQQVRYSANTNKLGISKKHSGLKKQAQKAAGSQKRQQNGGWQGQFGSWHGGAGYPFDMGYMPSPQWPVWPQTYPGSAARQGSWMQDPHRTVRRRVEQQPAEEAGFLR